MSRRRSQPFHLVTGFSIWAAGFLGLYSLLSIGCAKGWNDTFVFGSFSLLRLQLSIGFAAILGSGAYLLRVSAANRRSSQEPSARFIHDLALGASLAALAASMFTFVGVTALSICD